MNLDYIIFLKAYREGKLMDIFIMSMIILASNYKDTFIAYLLIPILFSDKFFNLLWSNTNEKLFYFQFQEIQLKKISSIKQIQFILEFNICYLLAALLFLIYQEFSEINQRNWIILNIFIFMNLVIANIIFNISFRIPFIKSLIILIANCITTLLVFFINAYLTDYSFITFFLILTYLIFYRSYTLNALFNNLHIKNFYD